MLKIHTNVQMQKPNIVESLSIKNIAEIDKVIEMNEKLLKELENLDNKEQSDLSEEDTPKTDYSELVEMCFDGFGGKYILKD